jgi:hypothetical protein
VAAAAATWIAIPSPRRRGSVVRRPSKIPAEPIQAGRFPADQSRLRAFGRGDLPAHHRQGPRWCVHRTRRALTLPTSHKLLVLLLARRTTMLSPSTASPLPCACAPIRRDLDDPCEGSGPRERGPCRVADEPGGVGRSRSPAFPSSTRPRRRREINPPRPPWGGRGIAKRRVRTPKASPGLQRDRLEMSGSFWLGPRSNAPTSPRRDGCSRWTDGAFRCDDRSSRDSTRGSQGAGPLVQLSPFEGPTCASPKEVRGFEDLEHSGPGARPGCANLALPDRHHRTSRRFYDACRSSGSTPSLIVQ